jgi:hypothetical protein
MSDASETPQGWRSFFTGWQFRSSTPSFGPGEEIEAYITGYDEARQRGEARIGDTIISVRGVEPAAVDQLVTLKILRFDPASNYGEAELVPATAP